MNQNSADACVYMKRESGHAILGVLYVDDLLGVSDNMETPLDTERRLRRRFKLKALFESNMILEI